MPNMFGGDQSHPAYDPRTKLADNQVMVGNDLYTIDEDDWVNIEHVDGTSERVHFSWSMPEEVRQLHVVLDNHPAWCAKYALTQGIFKIAGRIRQGGKRIMAKMAGHYQSFGEKEFDLTLEGAKVKAEALRKKKLASLKKQLSRIEKLEIKVNDEQA